MPNKFISGIIAGGMLGATASMYLNKKISRRKKRLLTRKGKNLIGKVTPFANIF